MDRSESEPHSLEASTTAWNERPSVFPYGRSRREKGPSLLNTGEGSTADGPTGGRSRQLFSGIGDDTSTMRFVESSEPLDGSAMDNSSAKVERKVDAIS